VKINGEYTLNKSAYLLGKEESVIAGAYYLKAVKNLFRILEVKGEYFNIDKKYSTTFSGYRLAVVDNEYKYKYINNTVDDNDDNKNLFLTEKKSCRIICSRRYF